MIVKTESGATYTLYQKEGKNPGRTLHALRNGESVGQVIAIFPDREACFRDTKRFQRSQEDSSKIEGFNEKGVRTFLLDPLQVKLGMILVAPNGLRSTRIISIA